MWRIYRQIPTETDIAKLRAWVRIYSKKPAAKRCDWPAKIVYAATLRLMELGYSPTPPPCENLF